MFEIYSSGCKGALSKIKFKHALTAANMEKRGCVAIYKNEIMEYSDIKNEVRYEEVAQRVEQLRNAEPDTEEAKEFKALIMLLVDYEKKQMSNTNKVLNN